MLGRKPILHHRSDESLTISTRAPNRHDECDAGDDRDPPHDWRDWNRVIFARGHLHRSDVRHLALSAIGDAAVRHTDRAKYHENESNQRAYLHVRSPCHWFIVPRAGLACMKN